MVFFMNSYNKLSESRINRIDGFHWF